MWLSAGHTVIIHKMVCYCCYDWYSVNICWTELITKANSIGCSLFAKYHWNCFTFIISFHPSIPLKIRYYYQPYFTDKGAEVQRN